jgi:hypothetical protein
MIHGRNEAQKLNPRRWPQNARLETASYCTAEGGRRWPQNARPDTGPAVWLESKEDGLGEGKAPSFKTYG